jgi:imidazolonepropionase-like amidohydrolase
LSCYNFNVLSLLRRPFGSLLLIVGLLVLASSCSSPQSNLIAIAHVTVIDVTGAPPQPDATVLIAGQRIFAIGPSSSTIVPRGAKIIDGQGKFLIPGLVDMHLHLTGAGEPTGSREFIRPLLVANGITTVRDMGGRVDLLKQLRHEIDAGECLGQKFSSRDLI